MDNTPELKTTEDIKIYKKEIKNKELIGQNEVNDQSRPKQIPSKFILFITSKAGIITIISSIVVIIVVAVTLSVVITKNDDINELTTDIVSESESQKIDETQDENNETENNNKENEKDNKESENNNKENEKDNKETENNNEETENNNEESEKDNKENENNNEETENNNEETENIQETENAYETEEIKFKSDTLYVKKVENIPKNFIYGMDISSVIAEEQSGVKYYNSKNEEKDLCEIVHSFGINYIRIRIWNDPYDSNGNGYGGGNNDMNKAIEIGKRATKYGMKVMASFHFSDFYADPAIQKPPKAWKDLNFEQKKQKAKEFIIESITRFKNEKINLGIVALGNEITTGFCGETEWPKIIEILNPCADAVKQILPDVLIAAHFTNPEREWGINYFADVLNENNYNYDILSTSYYPFWHGDLTNLKNKFNYIAETYNKKVLIAETSYPYSLNNFDLFPNTNPSYEDVLFYPISVQGQATHLRNLIETVAKSKNGLGIFYWEPAWIPIKYTNWEDSVNKWNLYGSGWASQYALSYDSHYSGGGGSVMDNQALFDPEGKPLESLYVFNLLKYGNEVTPIEDGVEDISVNPIDFEQFSFPETITVIDTSEQRSTRNVAWDDGYDANKAKNIDGNSLTYEFNGKAGNIDIKCIFKNNSNQAAVERKFVCSYYIGSKFLSPWRLQRMVGIRDL